jgi:serine/threonine protein kinase
MIDFAQLQPGFVFAGRYRIESLLSTGGMGAVYVVRHLETDAKLALKVMRPEIVENADARRRFAQEARVASMIESTHVVAVTDAGVDDQLGVPFLVMELLQGRELGDELAARGRIPPAEVVAWLAQVARALDKAHAKGIVHRDLKPENLFMVRTDEEPDKIKILDFGIAKFLQGSGSHTTAASGTPLYMAPEQTAQGNLIGPATDTWALGLIAYTLLVGQPYWQAETIYQLFGEVLSLNREAPSARAVKHGAALPAAFDAWLLKAIAPDPQHRWQRASEAITKWSAFSATLNEWSKRSGA